MQTLYERLGGQTGIRQLLKHFYADVRQHNILGPIFNAQIQDWPEHLARIEEFWARQAGGPSTYDGGFASAHLQLGLGSEHFEHWLALWEWNCQRHLQPPEATEMIDRAREIAIHLKRILAGRPLAQ